MDDKITKYVPEFSVINPFDPKALPTTTFRQLATHLSGLQYEYCHSFRQSPRLSHVIIDADVNHLAPLGFAT
jgi:CubicO group peptidase (beta-lactamase class C family)